MNKIIKSITMVMLALLALTSSVSAYEIRGQIANSSHVWTYDNFAGFFFDRNSDQQVSEVMAIVVTGGSTESYSGQTIEEGKLAYITHKVQVNEAHKAPYYVVGWLGESYVAVGGRTNKIAKLIMNMDDTDSKTLTEGGTLSIGSGYVLKMNSIDARASPRQAWFTLLRNEISIDEGVIQNNQNYTYTANVLGDSDVPILSFYVESIFSGTEVSMMKIKYVWMIDPTTAKEIKPGDKIGIMEVLTADSDKIIMQSKSSISLTKNSEINIMGNLDLRTGNGANFLYYPKIDINADTILNDAIGMNINTAKTVAATITAPCNNTTVIKEVIKEVVKEVPVEKIVYVTPEPTPEPTPTPASPNTSVLIVVGLIGLVYVIGKLGRNNE